MIRLSFFLGKRHRWGLVRLINASQETRVRRVCDLGVPSMSNKAGIAIALFWSLHEPLDGIFFPSGDVDRAPRLAFLVRFVPCRRPSIAPCHQYQYQYDHDSISVVQEELL